MSNRITELNEVLKANAEAEAENVTKMEQPELTASEKEQLKELENKEHLVFSEVGADGVKNQIPLSEFTEELDKRVVALKGYGSQSDAILKTVSTGDIRKSVDAAKEEAKANVLKAYQELSVSDTARENDDILRINDEALKSLQEYFKVERFDTDTILAKMGKLTLRQICTILPKEFVEIYVRDKEITANNYKAKERLLTVISYLGATGPELDYLNEYIDNEHKLMAVSNELIKCQLNFADVLKDPQKMSEIVTAARSISTPDESIWSRVIVGDPKRVHNEFAQRSVIWGEYVKAYEKIMAEHETDTDAVKAIIQEQIDEAVAKRDVYASVMELTTARALWENVCYRINTNRKTSYMFLLKEAQNALERIRKSKQNVPFPVYNESLAKNPEALFNAYVERYTEHLMHYNEILLSAANKVPEDLTEEVEKTDVHPIKVEGVDDHDVCEYFSLFLLILYGRLMKKLADRDSTKYNAIELDAYFELYCKLALDIYLMKDIWDLMSDMVTKAVKSWPIPKKPVKGKKK